MDLNGPDGHYMDLELDNTSIKNQTALIQSKVYH